jgi:hypothetical protein
VSKNKNVVSGFRLPQREMVQFEKFVMWKTFTNARVSKLDTHKAQTTVFLSVSGFWSFLPVCALSVTSADGAARLPI